MDPAEPAPQEHDEAAGPVTGAALGGSAPGAVRRPRRLRRTPALRRLVAQTRLHPADLVLPVFVKEGASEPTPIESMPGVVQHFSIPASAFDESVFEDGLAFDGSSVRGFQEIHESDMLLLPDEKSAVLDPFRAAKTLIVNFFVHDPFTREAYSRDPRNVARKAEDYLASTGIADTAFFAPEAEFYIFDDVRYAVTPQKVSYQIDAHAAAWNTDTEYEMGNQAHRAGHLRQAQRDDPRVRHAVAGHGVEGPLQAGQVGGGRDQVRDGGHQHDDHQRHEHGSVEVVGERGGEVGDHQDQRAAHAPKREVADPQVRDHGADEEQHQADRRGDADRGQREPGEHADGARALSGAERDHPGFGHLHLLGRGNRNRMVDVVHPAPDRGGQGRNNGECEISGKHEQPFQISLRDQRSDGDGGRPG